MQKLVTLQKILDSGMVAIVRTDNADQALRAVDACLRGGVTAVEITFTVPGAAEAIRQLTQAYPGGEIVIGAGTVLDSETARAAILAGAQFIVTPSLNVETIRLCNRYQIPTMPGAMTIKEILEAMEAGADIVKVFPGDLLGPSFIKAVHGPLPQAPLMPTGGVTLENVGEWIRNGCPAVGVGGSLTAGVRRGDYEAVTDVARQFIAKIREAKGLAK